MEEIKKDSINKMTIAEQILASIDGLTAKQSDDIVDTIISTIKESLIKKEQVKISGFGVFSINEKKARKGRNPSTGEAMTIAPRHVVSFKVSSLMKKFLNENLFGPPPSE